MPQRPSLMLLSLLILSSMVPRARADGDDKLLHVGATAAISYLGMVGLCQLGLQTPQVEIGGFVIGFGAGVIKELSDDESDSGDLVADGIGAAAGTALGYATLGCSRGGRTRRSDYERRSKGKVATSSLAHLR